VRTRTAAMAALATAAVLASAPAALAAPAIGHRHAAAGAIRPAFAGSGAEPSLSLSVNPGGKPEVASVGKSGSLWYTYHSGGTWHRVEVAKSGTASGPSLYAGPGSYAIIAVQGPSHSLLFFSLSGGRWHRSQVAGKNTAYSAPDLVSTGRGPAIAVQGPHNSLVYYWVHGSHWLHTTVGANGTAFSAPSLVVRGPNQSVHGHPSSEIDIAVQNAHNSLSYYNSLSNGHWQNDVIGGPGTTFSAPTLTVVGGTTFQGDAVVFAEGAHHSLWGYAWSPGLGFVAKELEGSNWCYSAPSLVQGDSATEFPVAFQGSGHSLFIVFEANPSTDTWQNEVVAATSSAYSAPAIFVRYTSPPGEVDIVTQGADNSMVYYHAPRPASGAPSFTGQPIAGAGTTFGG